MKLVSLASYRNRELVGVLKGLLEMAENGHAQGLAFVVKVGRGAHRTGLAGDYRRHPDEAVSAAVRLKEQVLLDPADEEQEESGT